MSEKGVLIVVSAPSGCGKSTVLHALMQMRSNLKFSVSATTRAPRAGEVDGVDYFFVSREKFRQMVEENAFLEHAEYAGNCYGTPIGPINEQLEKGCDVYLDIDVQGAMQVKKLRPDTLMIFMMPPSFEELERRLTSRGTDRAEVILERLERAKEECRLSDQYDFVVVNDDVARVTDEVNAIINEFKKIINNK